MRAFSDADLVQAATGTGAAAASVNVTVPAGTVEGSTGIICMFAQNPIAAPDQWEIAASAGAGGLLAVMCRGDVLGGESSWPFNAAVGTPNWTWTAGEWANTAPAPAESSASVTGGVSPLSTGSTGTFSTQFVMGIVAFGISGGTPAAWPAVSYSDGFAETDSVQVGTGSASGDLLLKVARRYGTDSDAGPWSCTATFTGDMTNKTPFGALVVFRAEETALPPLVLTP